MRSAAVLLWACGVLGGAASGTLIAQEKLRRDPASEPPAAGDDAGEPEAATTQPGWSAAPLDADESERRPWLRLDELKFDFGFEGELSRRRVNSRYQAQRRGSFSQTDELRRFEETVGLTASGALFDERWLTFDVLARGGLSQEDYNLSRPGPDLGNTPYGEALEYDARLGVLPAGKLSANLFAAQLDDRVPRPFLPSLDRRRERYGTDLIFSDRTLPMRLSFESLGETLGGPDARPLDAQERDEQRLDYEATWQINEHQQLRFDYEYLDQHDRYAGTGTGFDTVRNDATLQHTLQFGPQQRSRWEFFGRFQDETGDLARDLYEIAPQLRFQHTDQFATYYKAQYLEDSYDGRALESVRGDVGLTHEWQQTLFSTLGLYALRSDAEQASDTSEWGGLADASFARENRWGRFSAHLGYAHTIYRTDGDDDRFGTIVSEAVTFRDPLPVTLAQDGVDRLSILVSDSSRRIVYLRGADYTVIQSGAFTRLVRVRNGRISDGQTVLVSYRYDVTQRLDTSRDRIDLRVQQDFKSGWTPYYSGTLQFESLSQDGFAQLTPRDIRRHRVGLRYRQKRWSASGEYEYNDDSVDPYQALHADGDVSLLNDGPQALDGRASYSYYDFEGAPDLEARNVHQLDLALDYRLALGFEREATFVTMYRYEDDSLFGRTHGVDVTGGVRWRIGDFWASVEVEYDLLDLTDSRDQGVAAWFKIRREFPVIGREP